ncbi:hypothetical protein K7432_018386, partial [Basidiobolus ranarum]
MYFSKTVLLSITLFLQVTVIQARISKDDRCGVIKGEKVTCPNGECCSSYGWCGTSKDHCVANCQFQCKTPKPTTIKPTLTVKPTSSAKPSATTSVVPSPTNIITSPDGSCGLKNGVLV